MPPWPLFVAPERTTAPLPASVASCDAVMPPWNPFCGTDGAKPWTAYPRHAVAGCPSRVSVAPMTPDALATAPPHAPPCRLQLPPPGGAVSVMIPYWLEPACVAPDAKRRRLPSGIRRSARPSFPSQPVATVEVPTVAPAGEIRVSKIDVFRAPRFQITCSTPSVPRASPSCTPGSVGPLIRDQPGTAAARACAAAAADTATRETASGTARRVRRMRGPPSVDVDVRPRGLEQPLERDPRPLDRSAHGGSRAFELAEDDLVLTHQDRPEVAHAAARPRELGHDGPRPRVERLQVGVL